MRRECPCRSVFGHIAMAKSHSERVHNMTTQTQPKGKAAPGAAGQTFFAMNRDHKVAIALTGFSCWEQVQGAFRCGIQIAVNLNANGIGRAKNQADFVTRCRKSGFTIVEEKSGATPIKRITPIGSSPRVPENITTGRNVKS